MQEMHQMRGRSQAQGAGQTLLRADQVRLMLGVDRSTVYRMAEAGRLPAVKIGRQWRFPAGQIERLVTASGGHIEPAMGRQALLLAAAAAVPVIDVAAEILGVMMVLADMDGEPLTEVINPCPWFSEHSGDPDLLAACLQDWKQLADDLDFEPRFRAGTFGFDCARTFVRAGSRLVGMLVAGGLAATQDESRALYRLDEGARARVLAAMPVIAARVSRLAAGYLSEVDPRSMT